MPVRVLIGGRCHPLPTSLYTPTFPLPTGVNPYWPSPTHTPGSAYLPCFFCVSITAQMLPHNFQIEVFPTRAAAASTLRKRATTPPAETCDRWVLAWDRFRTESFAYIKPTRCFRESDSNSTKKRKEYRTKYRHQAVLHFLPHFNKLLPLVTGKHRQRVQEALKVLNKWKRTLPAGYCREFKKIEAKNQKFCKGDSPPPILLPMPPTKHKVTVHPAPQPPEQQLGAPSSRGWSASKQYPGGFSSDDWDVGEDS